MSQDFLRALASAVLYLHFAVVVFNVFWMVAIPIGAWRGWKFVRNFWWRAAHVAVLAVVALQTVVGALCFLTVWQNALIRAAGGRSEEMALIERIVTRAVFWPLPLWAFVVLYVAAFAYTVALWWLVPPYKRKH
jgi:Protein of Unknown function (DUF2784)